MEVTIITPIAPEHRELFVRCANSVREQTVKVRHLHKVDDKRVGPGAIRNLLLKEVKTPYTIFLDADDYLEPDFVEKCLTLAQGDRYVYTKWFEDGETSTIKETPAGAFWDTAWHLVTCLIHTDMLRIVEGFNEVLPGMEDTELFLKFDEYAYCGIEYPEALVHYTNQGNRSKELRKSGEVVKVKEYLNRRYAVGCCGSDNEVTRRPVGTRYPGDVLAMALWGNKCHQGGASSGRRYPRIARPDRAWVDPEDIKLNPNLWRVIPPKKSPSKPDSSVQVVKKPRAEFEEGTLEQALTRVGMAVDRPVRVDLAAHFSDTDSTEINPDYSRLMVLVKEKLDELK